jgi:hypothetical protein
MMKARNGIRSLRPSWSRRVRIILAVIAVLAMVFSLSIPAYAVRAHYGRVLAPRLEKEGKYEDAALYYREGLDFYAAMLQLWIGWGVYDTRGDEIYDQYVTIFGTDKGYRGAHNEERWDPMGSGGYYYFFNREGTARSVDKGQLSRAQRERLEDRARIYIEDLMDPDHGFGGDFAFPRKAWILERTGLFWHASFRRELAGRYMIMVCSRYCDAVADEMERVFGDQTRAKLYREKATWWQNRGLEEFRLCNGDRILARLKGNSKAQRLDRQEVVRILEKGLRDEDMDARRASVRILSDLGEFAALKAAMQDKEIEIRKAAAATFADKMYLPGLALALQDEASEVTSVAKAVLQVKADDVGPYLRAVHFLADGLQREPTSAFAADQLRQLSGLELGDTEAEWQDWVQRTTGGNHAGIVFEYLKIPSQKKPITTKVLDTIDVGMKLQINFPRVFYDYWDKPEVFPADATGPFLLRIKGRLYVPHDGNYRFYARTVVESRATVSIRDTDGSWEEIISPDNDSKLQYVMQPAMPTHRIDFSTPIALKKGLADLEIIYSGDEVRNVRQGDDHIVRTSGVQMDGIKLFWSSDRHLTELVPADHLFHKGEAK